MRYRELYEQQLNDNETRYFVIDSGVGIERGLDEVEFSYYKWSRSSFNKVRPNDLFIYRRPTRVSSNGKFYFFGSGRFSSIEDLEGPARFVDGHITDAIVFDQHLYQDDDIIENFYWTFKEKGNNWHNFFNQYGMTEINREDFENILKINESLSDEVEIINYSSNEEVQNLSDIRTRYHNQDYRVTNQEATIKVRGAAQRTFSNAVRDNYRNKCSITGIKTRELLVASHIIPWAADEDNRLNPANGILLSNLIDKAFDKGYISFDDEYKLMISSKAEEDLRLHEYLVQYNRKRINTNGGDLPDLRFLEWHRNNLFKGE